MNPTFPKASGRSGKDPERILKLASAGDIGEVYSCQTESPKSKGIFSIPSFIVDGELFWGNDRLEDAVSWTLR